jgi:hypothetical protein
MSKRARGLWSIVSILYPLGNILRFFLVMAFLLVNMGCTTRPPTLNAIVPGTGYPRQLLSVDGDSLFASVIWDVGLPTETSIYNGLFGTRYFQIPATATAGVHPVILRNSNGSSSTVNVTVLAASGTFPPPRIEDIGIFSTSATANPDVLLMVTGANLDTDATVTVNGSAVKSTISWGALPVAYLQNHVPASFGYPIYHYLQLMNIVESVTLGTALNVVVTNTDGQTAAKTYTLPGSLAQLDADGDGLLDSYDGGTFTAPSGGTIDLAAMGTQKGHKDLLVEVDWINAAAPNAGIWDDIENVFRDAPVLNPDGSRGINIIIDRGQGEPFTGGGDILDDHTTMDFGANSASGYVDFFTYKSSNFDNDRLTVFHYAVFGRARPNGSSGRGEVFGNDFMVTFRNFGNWTQDIAQAGTFVHELGHNLGLTHGDLLTTPAQWNETQKPNFPTTMSYRYQFPGVSIDCDFATESIHTYSQGMFARVTESGVNENTGICDNAPLDMNGDGTLTNGPMDVSQDGDSTDTHDDFDQWGNLILDFDGPGSSWNNN